MIYDVQHVHDYGGFRALPWVGGENVTNIRDNSRRMQAVLVICQKIERFRSNAKRFFGGEYGPNIGRKYLPTFRRKFLISAFSQCANKIGNKFLQWFTRVDARQIHPCKNGKNALDRLEIQTSL